MDSITITEAAREYLADLLRKQEKDNVSIRIFVSQAGTPHAETCVAYCQLEENEPADIRIDLPQFVLWIDSLSQPFLEDAIVDYAIDRMGGQLTIKAPNAKLPQISENSSLAEQVVYFLQTEVNPGLASHGGMVSLIDMDDNVAVLQFGGGCQGCGQVGSTLQDGVERILLERIPALKGVRDVTDHTDRENAYY
ncbi:UNVERIFIED_CONTAM: hypothetical protein GTU68_066251 [Idotea baltica]|nr:hypothetical protein [Idotea baltica]